MSGRAHDEEAVRHEDVRREAGRADEGPLPLDAVAIGRAGLLRLQRAGGNEAVTGLLQRQSQHHTHASPTNLRMDSHGSPIPSDPSGLQVTIRWDSSTGNLADLAGAGVLREHVTRIGTVPIPPFVAGLSIVLPVVDKALPETQVTRGWAYDSHFGFGPRLQPTVGGSFVSLQEYQWGPSAQGPWQTLATFHITRTVYPRRGGHWYYRVAKNLVSGGTPLWVDTELHPAAAPAPAAPAHGH